MSAAYPTILSITDKGIDTALAAGTSFTIIDYGAGTWNGGLFTQGEDDIGVRPLPPHFLTAAIFNAPPPPNSPTISLDRISANRKYSRSLIQAEDEPMSLEVWTAKASRKGVLRREFNLMTPGDYKVVLLGQEASMDSNPCWHGAGLSGQLVCSNLVRPFVFANDGQEHYSLLHY